MNILFIEKTFDGTLGGSHTCLYNLINCLDNRKYTIFVGLYQNNSYTSKLQDIGIRVIFIKRNPHLAGLVIIRKMRNWYRLVYLHRLQLKKILLTHKIDLLVLNNSISGCNDHLQVCKKIGVPVIVYERGFINYSKADISLTDSIHASIAVSRAVYKNMNYYQYRNASSVIYDGLPVDQILGHNVSEIEKIKWKWSIPRNSIVIGIIGNIREWKGQEYFVKAFLLLSKKYYNMYALVVGGYGIEDEQYLKRLENLAVDSVARERLIYTGYREDISDLLRIMDVFVHASIRPEPFGMVILEAMLQKVPVIASNIGGPVEILMNGECGILVPPQNEAAIANAIEKYLNNPSFRNEMVDNAFKRMIKDFDLRKTVKQTEEIFQGICRANYERSISIANKMSI